MPERGANGYARVKFSNPMLRKDIALRVRSTVRGMQADANPSFTLRQFVEEAFAAYCQLLEDRYHDGKPWPEVEDPLTAGRPSGY
ncbi:hypothetical protein [Krasilnikovia sp. MM14-A1259]|uniref:hypothetical protein n=1 Tax=Krasilnikovia sp. MM14-A1259 TaxID=3373539 RepID=UPI00382BF737